MRAGIGMVRRLPGWMLSGMAVVLGDCTYLFWPRGRRNAIRNMAILLGDGADPRNARRLARMSFRHYLRVMGDFVRLPDLSFQEVRDRLIASGLHHLDAALAHGKGAILVGTHLGNWDLAGLIVALYGYPINAIVERFAWPEVDRLVQGSRARWGLRPIPMDYALRHVYKALRANQVVGILVDRPVFNNGVPVTLFGRRTGWPSGPATLALRTGAKVLVGYLVYLPDGRYQGELCPVQEPQLTGDQDRDVAALTQAIVSALEGPIRAHPEQWCMFRQMWPESSQEA